MKNKIGIIGYGGVADYNHRTSYKLSKDAEVVAVCDIDPKALQKAKQKVLLFGTADAIKSIIFCPLLPCCIQDLDAIFAMICVLNTYHVHN